MQETSHYLRPKTKVLPEPKKIDFNAVMADPSVMPDTVWSMKTAYDEQLKKHHESIAAVENERLNLLEEFRRDVYMSYEIQWTPAFDRMYDFCMFSARLVEKASFGSYRNLKDDGWRFLDGDRSNVLDAFLHIFDEYVRVRPRFVCGTLEHLVRVQKAASRGGKNFQEFLREVLEEGLSEKLCALERDFALPPNQFAKVASKYVKM